jgi:hypothetical protein
MNGTRAPPELRHYIIFIIDWLFDWRIRVRNEKKERIDHFLDELSKMYSLIRNNVARIFQRDLTTIISSLSRY